MGSYRCTPASRKPGSRCSRVAIVTTLRCFRLLESLADESFITYELLDKLPTLLIVLIARETPFSDSPCTVINALLICGKASNDDRSLKYIDHPRVKVGLRRYCFFICARRQSE